MRTALSLLALALAGCACGSPPPATQVEATPLAPPPTATQVAPEPAVVIPEVAIARTTFGCDAEGAASVACSAIARFESGHAPATPTQASSYIGVASCPSSVMEPDVGMYTILVVTSRDGDVVVGETPTMTTRDMTARLTRALDTPDVEPADADVGGALEAARVMPFVTIDELTPLTREPALDASTVGAWILRELDGSLYEIDRADAQGNVCVTAFRPTPARADFHVDEGQVVDGPPPPEADADVRTFVEAHVHDIEAVAARALAPCAAQRLRSSPAHGTPVARWAETVGVSASCMTATPEGAASGSDFLSEGDPHAPAGSWASYGRDGTHASACGFEDHDCTDYSVFRADPRYVEIDVNRSLPGHDGWVEVKVLLHR